MRIFDAKVTGKLTVRFDDFRSATLLEPVTFEWSDEDGQYSLTAPEGYKFNGVGPDGGPWSWVLEIVAPRWGRGDVAALPHDLLFEHDTLRVSVPHRKYADRVFLAFLLATGPERKPGLASFLERLAWKVTAYRMYYAVRWFGAGVWNAHDRSSENA